MLPKDATAAALPDAPPLDALVLDRVTKRYGRGAAVIENLSATFAPGTATGLVGPNGSGKTTLLRMLTVLSYPTGGQISHGDLDIHAHPHRYLERVGVVHDETALPEALTAVELLAWIFRARRDWDDHAPRRIADLLDAVRLDERRQNLIGTYSSGMRRKTQIAAALVAAPSIVLMDEPFRGLDTVSTAAVLDLLRAFKDGGGILVLSSHLHDALADLVGDTLTLG